MNRIRKILVASDHSGQAQCAETRAAMLSLELPASALEIMTVAGNGVAMTAAGALARIGRIERIGRNEAGGRQDHVAGPLQDTPGIHVMRSVRGGKTAEAVIARSREIGADLTVVAAREKTALAGLFARDSNEQLTRLTERPLLMVKQTPQATYTRVLVAVDFSDAARAAARLAMEIAPLAHITFIHAVCLGDEEMMRKAGMTGDVLRAFRMRACAKGRARLSEFIDCLGPRRQLMSRVVEHGDAVAVITACARRQEIDLIALGKHEKSRIREFLARSVTQGLVQESACDLLIVPPRNEGGWDDRPAA